MDQPRWAPKSKPLVSRSHALKLTTDDVLQDQAALSIAERCGDLKRRDGIDLKPYELRKVYRDLGVNKKKVRLKAPRSPAHLTTRRMNETINLKYGIEYVVHKEIPLYFMDECSFTSKDFFKYSWSNAHKNVLVDFQRAPPNIAVSGVMDEHGMILHIIRKKSIRQWDHEFLIKELRKKVGHRR